MITGDQIVAHLVGDYILQSDWMANEKTKRTVAALVHVLFYSLSFLFLRPSFGAWLFIVSTHFVIDRWRLARYLCWLKNFLAPLEWRQWRDDEGEWFRVNPPFVNCSVTGYPPERPTWLATWLFIIADNTLHLICNGVALRWL